MHRGPSLRALSLCRRSPLRGVRGVAALRRLAPAPLAPLAPLAPAPRRRRPRPRAVRSAAAAAAAVAMEEEVLAHDTDVFNGVAVRPGALPAAAAEFAARLELSEAKWRGEGRVAAWIHVPANRATLVPAALAQGYELHHCRGGLEDGGYIMLTKWYAAPPSKLPPFANVRTGVGAVVLNAAGELLCVQEKNGPLKGAGVWKVPTGLVDPGEDLQRAAEREVLEECGVRATFHRLLAFRQQHGLVFGQSDLFFLVALKLDGPDQPIRVQESEIEAGGWVTLDDYGAQPYWRENHDRDTLYGKVGRRTAAPRRAGSACATDAAISPPFLPRSDVPDQPAGPRLRLGRVRRHGAARGAGAEGVGAEGRALHGQPMGQRAGATVTV